jgi:hypothetical protein
MDKINVLIEKLNSLEERITQLENIEYQTSFDKKVTFGDIAKDTLARKNAITKK